MQIYSGSRREERKKMKEMEVEKFNLVDFSQMMSSQ
jgi:hypothetical protein